MKILIIRLSSIGDIILSEPISYLLKRIYPLSEINYLTKETFVPLIETFRSIDNVIPWNGNYQELKKLSEFDMVIDLHKKMNTFLISLLLKKKQIIRYNKKHLLRWMIIRKHTKDRIDSTLDLYMTVFNKIKKPVKRVYPQIKINAKDCSAVDRILSDYAINLNKTLVAIYPGATHNTKKYPADQLIDFIKSFAPENNVHFIIHGSEKDKYEAQLIKLKCGNRVTDLCGTTSLSETIALINRMDCVLTNDSGPMHIAAALGKPQIAVFGATHTDLGFRPLNEKAIVLQAEICCQPCSLHGEESCPQGTFACMRSIGSEEISEALITLLEKHVWKLEEEKK